jgi:hypothetical protein
MAMPSPGAAPGAGRPIALASGAIVAIAGYRVVNPPGPSGLLHLMWGTWVAVACGVPAIVGGMLTAHADERDDDRGADAGQRGPDAGVRSVVGRAWLRASADDLTATDPLVPLDSTTDRRSLAQRDRSPPTR